MLIYLIVRGHTMHEHREQDQQQYAAFRDYVRDRGASSGAGDDLSKLADLRDRGVLTSEEFERAKERTLQ